MSNQSASVALLTKAEFARQLNVSIRTLERYIRDGDVEVTRLPSGRVRIHPSELKRVAS